MSPNETETLKTEIPKMNENRRALTLIPYYMHLGVYIWKKKHPLIQYACFWGFFYSLKLSFKNIWSLCLNFVDCESFLEWNSPDILALCEANLYDSIGSENLSVRSYLPLIWKDSSTHMHDLTVYVKEGLPFAWELSLKNSTDSFLCFWLALLHSMSYFFFLSQLLSLSLCMIFYFLSSNIYEVF